MTTTPAPAARRRNSRRVALDILRNIKKNVAVMAGEWDVRMTVWDNAWRQRRDDEKPENRPEDWARLILFMNQVIDDAETVRYFARQQIERIEQETAK